MVLYESTLTVPVTVGPPRMNSAVTLAVPTLKEVPTTGNILAELWCDALSHVTGIEPALPVPPPVCVTVTERAVRVPAQVYVSGTLIPLVPVLIVTLI
jgi:hypothetical protein